MTHLPGCERWPHGTTPMQCLTQISLLAIAVYSFQKNTGRGDLMFIPKVQFVSYRDSFTSKLFFLEMIRYQRVLITATQTDQVLEMIKLNLLITSE